MQTVFQIGDFDLDIEKVLLVHKCIYEKRYKSSEYVKGRNMCGLVLCISGKAKYDFGNDQMLLEPGQLVYLPPSCAYTIQSAGDEPFFHITANFVLRQAKGDAGTVFSDIISGKYRYVSSKERSDYIKELLERLVSVWQNKKYGYGILAKSILYEVLYTYFTDAGNTLGKNAGYGMLMPAKAFLDEQYMADTSVSELAEMCSVSETHFRRLFSRLFGCSPTEYRLKKRLLKAKDMLLSGDFTVSETAFAVGFEDANYFSRIFKARTGISPVSLRNNKSDVEDNGILILGNTAEKRIKL